MSKREDFAAPLLEDLLSRKARFAACGYFKRSNFDENPIITLLPRESEYDLNIRFGRRFVPQEAKFSYEMVEIEVFDGLKNVYESDIVFRLTKNYAEVEYYRRMKKEEKVKLKNYLASLGYKGIKFRFFHRISK
ncbi:MAG: hypothetical protein NZ942_00060 [Candidatus Aenigmarchaeota archaeon]|nr:hypothetical protein [Candidatus Aenigmarchaeota archaeon]